MPFHLDQLSVPIVQAPMAGGASTPELVAAVNSTGALGFLAAGYRTADGMRQQVARTRELTSRPFGVNVFVPGAVDPAAAAAVGAYRDELRAEAERFGITLPVPPAEDDDAWEAKIEALLHDPVPVVSFAFGLPSAAEAEALHRAGSLLVATVTTVAEAEAAQATGVDALCVQGPEAGGHRSTHDITAEPGTVPLPELLAAVRERVRLPLVAAGGLGSGEDVAAVLRGGACAAQLGTLYLRAHESGASQTHKDALADARFTTTAVTRAFSGRPARGLRNRFIDAHDSTAPGAYPHVHHLTRSLRSAAAEAGDAERLHLWAGARYRLARCAPAAEITRTLWEETRAALSVMTA
ncbi:NAD(P)H-dependent flavin oxidoreductase [Streptomyces morookaense]|uniref:Probable nitronate monooxygenase n=1 Tax=Streptomyces morookaense TaxID=1970 RepID=A0A7Y7E9L0_STRMO|nr:nitronate monooxygenase [Streptomyces morookaense]NVK80536.1 nitronate monooxygenase [Streptomyces morookaense]GHF47073.1 oxidoreductase [Streptomyces morookaense]